MNHKRKRPKNRRAGCLMCKPQKANGCKRSKENIKIRDRRIIVSEREQRLECSS